VRRSAEQALKHRRRQCAIILKRFESNSKSARVMERLKGYEVLDCRLNETVFPAYHPPPNPFTKQPQTVPKLNGKLSPLCKEEGTFSQDQKYMGLANTYDYGPMGTELIRNIRNLWWENFVHQREDKLLLVRCSPFPLQASLGKLHHVGGLLMPWWIEKCKSRFRVDHLIEGLF